MQRGHGSRTVARRFSGSPDASPALDQLQQPSSQLLRGSLQSMADGISAFPTQKNQHAETAGSLLGGSRRGAGGGDDAMSLDDAGDVGQRLEVLLADDQHEGGGSLQLGVSAAHGGTGAGTHHHDGGAEGAAGDEEADGEGHAAAEPPTEPPPGPVTDTIMTGLVGMQQRKAAIEQQVRVAVDFLEAMKKDFVERMNRLKAEVGSYCGSQEAAWRDTNAHTQEALSRLEGARQLVRSLGLNAGHPDAAAGLLQDLEGAGQAEGGGH
ncbi:hypothetical protein CHLRE_07g329450v5 [Chlamydomonas reinhardtii]|uniref:Uncharacterized protein n=1 Tax=Chlamydomonas reinhardtii TaxID=3055 RepID=A8IHC8_CHLRE|nr:uncharacterized protein CHLRE_07g329450v5 [Chlamydomonas reinhardtii]PNW80782.1 hypothetical protein CHLRE_07g329450v5 [Chlamydomonas reinhardtii]|eukprot:XP_001690450.1 predicted protein [Chlamydomonas reinhardtii]